MFAQNFKGKMKDVPTKFHAWVLEEDLANEESKGGEELELEASKPKKLPNVRKMW